MHNAFNAALVACDPARGHYRAYRIEAGKDLFGDWLVDITYGRIGSRGRSIRYLAADEAEARKIVRKCLQRRGTARKRIGVAYQFLEINDSNPTYQASSGSSPSFGDSVLAINVCSK